MTSILPTINTALNTTNVTASTESSVMTAGINESGVAVSASWSVSTPAPVTFDSGVKASLVVQDSTYTAAAVGAAGNSTTIEYLDSTKAAKAIQDLTYTADAKGTGGNSITVAYATGGSAGNEVVSVVGDAISVAIQDQASYVVKTFTSGTFASGTFQNITYKSKLITAVNNIKIAYAGGGFGGQEASVRSGSGTAGDPYVITVTMQGTNEYYTALYDAGVAPYLLINGLTFTSVVRDAGVYVDIDFDGGGTAGAEVVTLSGGSGTAIDPYKILIVIESGVSTAAQVKTAYDLVGAVTAIATVAVTTAGTCIATVATPLANGVTSSVNVTSNVITTAADHGYLVGTRVRAVTPGGALPDPLVAGTDYWVESTPATNTLTLSATYGGGAIDITDQGASGVTFSLVPAATLTSEIETAIAADANSAATVARTVGADIVQATMVATALAGGVASPIDQSAETITVPTHGYTTGNKVAISGGGLPTGLVSPAWAVVVDGSTLKFATSYANAMSATTVNISSDGDETTTYTLTPAYSTATMVKAAVDASVAAAALVDVSVTGTAGNFQTIQSVTSLANGHGGAAGSEEVVIVGTVAKVYIETGVSTAAQIKTAWDLVAAAVALAAIATTGGGAGQVVAAATPLAGGVDNDFTKHTETNPDRITITGHGLITGSLITGITTTGVLPAALALLTPYYVIRVDDNTIKLATSLANALAGINVNLTNDGSATHTITAGATTGSCYLAWSVDSVIWEAVPSGFGGETVADIGAVSVNMWSICNVEPCYFKLIWTQTAGLTSSLIVKWTSK